MDCSCSPNIEIIHCTTLHSCCHTLSKILMLKNLCFITAANPIDFGRTVLNNCPAFSTGAKVEKPDFKPHHLYGNNGRTTFTAEIGQSGSEQGYLALTGTYKYMKSVLT